MIISRFMIIIAAFGIGLLLSAIHFGGLWLTVRRLPRCEQPRLFFWSSYLGRYGITLWGFAQIISYGPLPFISAFLGFYLLRTYALANYCGIGILEFVHLPPNQRFGRGLLGQKVKVKRPEWK